MEFNISFKTNFYRSLFTTFLNCSAECEDKGGTKDGDCAQGYGVCCICKWYYSFDNMCDINSTYTLTWYTYRYFCFVVQVECGATITQNNTYFTKPSSFSTGECAVQLCPGEDICQVVFTKFKTYTIVWYSIKEHLKIVNNIRYVDVFRNELVH